jgi:hypothetical protein
LERRKGDMLALACRGVSAALSARYKSGLEARREQHELILLHPHSTVPSYAATNPLTSPKGSKLWLSVPLDATLPEHAEGDEVAE